MFDEELWVYAKGDLKIPFSYKEGKLLKLFMQNRGRILTYSELCLKIIGCVEDEITKEYVRKKISNLVSRVKVKIGDDGEITTLIGKGYRLEV